MSLQSRLGCWWIRLTMKQKPPGEAALVDFTRRRFNPPGWIVSMHSAGMKIERIDSSVKGEWISDPKAAPGDKVIYYLHGGGYISGSAKTGRPLTAPLARKMGVRLFTIDYRLAPEHRFPAGLDDIVAGYHWLLSTGLDPRNLSVMGDSAGGGLALALAMTLRDSGAPLPASLVCLSPWTDMTGNSATIKANAERDPMFVAEDCHRYSSAYLGEHSRLDPLASPLLGNLAGLPPMLIQVGRNEVLLDDARSLHEKVRATGGSSELHIFEGVPHGWHFGAPFVPESNEALRQIAEFVNRH
jgi:acetyl esterase/lipase